MKTHEFFNLLLVFHVQVKLLSLQWYFLGLKLLNHCLLAALLSIKPPKFLIH